mmetsp:Transcript_139328/g.242524  ORF Transcript_139328/g.242524 Transcript_139328/m.242524 type:complete len:82 (-) Transcript_139328:73-318(-)
MLCEDLEGKNIRMLCKDLEGSGSGSRDMLCKGVASSSMNSCRPLSLPIPRPQAVEDSEIVVVDRSEVCNGKAGSASAALDL